MFKLEQGQVPVGFSADCVGPIGQGKHLKGAWGEVVGELEKISSKGKFVLCEIPLFRGAVERLAPTVVGMGLRVGFHGKIGVPERSIEAKKVLIHNGLDSLMADEKGMGKFLKGEAEAVYGLIHAERFWQLVKETEDVEAVARRLASPGKLVVIENGDASGSFDRAVMAVERGNQIEPGRFVLMIDWLHLLKDTGGRVIDGNFVSLCDQAAAKATEILQRTEFVFGEHGAFGLRADDSHNLEVVRNNPDYLTALRRLYEVGENFRERLLVKVIETQYEPADYLKLDFGLIKFLKQRNRQLVHFLAEELGWI